MSVDLIEPPVATEQPPQTHHHHHRERLLDLSLSGRYWRVVEVHYHRIGPGDEEADWSVEAFEVSGWFSSAARAGRQRAELEREGKWLSEESKQAMRQGRTLRVADLTWEATS